MSYALAAAFGDVSTLRDTLPVFYPASVYVFRIRTTGAAIQTARDALAFVRAFGQQTNLGVDIRGVAVWHDQDQTGDASSLDLVFTVPSWSMRTPFYGDSPDSLAAKVQADASLRSAFPSLTVDSAIFGDLTAPAQAVDFWRNQPVLWTSAHEGEFGSGSGGPTNSFAKPPAASVVQGKADDGSTATPYPAIDTPIVTPPGPASGLLSGSVSPGVLLALGLLAVGAGYYWYEHQHKKGARL